MLKEQQENIRQNTKIARICADSQELKELRFKLQSAMVTKERSNQIQEKLIRQEGDAVCDAQLDEMMKEDVQIRDIDEYNQRIREQANRHENK